MSVPLRNPSDRSVAGYAMVAFLGARTSRTVPAGVRSGLLVACLSTMLSALMVAKIIRARSVSWPAGAAGATPAVGAGAVLGLALGLALGLVCSLLADRSLSGLQLPAATLSANRWEVELATDPAWQRGSVAAEGRVDGKRVQIRASGSPAFLLTRLQAGHRFTAQGRIRNLEGPTAGWLVGRHIAGRLSVTALDNPRSGSPLYRFANGVRSRLLRSGEVLPRHQRGLFAGFVLGDDRDQAPELVDDFRASGLSHLLVVSGQNVAFTLAVLEPALRWCRRRVRLCATLVVLVLFATVTRFEPSVLRAVWMAGVVATARCVGRPQKGLRVLSLAVVVLLLIDPLLTYSLGFCLSLAATAGLALWSEPLSRCLPLPGPIRAAVAPTLAAQAGACTVMIPAFGTVPVVSLLANVVVVPLAAPLMGWGVGAGIPAGMLGPGVSGVVHVPTSMVLTVVAWAARTAGRVPLGSVSVVPAALFALATWWVCRSTGVHRARLWAAALVGLVAWPGVAALSSPPQPDSGRAVERGVRVWTSAPRRPALSLAGITRSAQIVVVTYDADIGRLLAALREHRFGAIDILVVANGGRRQADLVRALRSRLSLGVVVVGDLAYGGGGAHVVRVKRATEATLGDLRLLVAPLEGGKLTVNITRVPGADSAA